MKNNANNYIGDELANKVKILSKALYQAENMVKILEQENENLRDAFINLASENKEDCDHCYEVMSVN